MCLEYSSQDHGILNPLCAQDYFSPRRLTSTSHNFKFLDECSIMSCNPDFIRNHFGFFHAFSRNCLHFVSLTRFVNILLYPCKRSFGRYIGHISVCRYNFKNVTSFLFNLNHARLKILKMLCERLNANELIKKKA